MRQIKFRAWSTHVKNMFPHEIIMADSAIARVIFPCVMRDQSDEEKLRDQRNKEILKIMQFTGLHDKEDKEIYEGDIVDYYGNDDEAGIIITTHEVFYQNSAFCMTNGLGADYLDETYKECIVIGNIYETPELLRK